MNYLICNATIVNEGKCLEGDVWIENGMITKVSDGDRDTVEDRKKFRGTIIDAMGLHLFPGVIDDQVHFREPGLTHKADISTESAAAVAGGITSFMEMPNTVPNAVTQELLAQKYERAAEVSLANYSFFMGATNSNLREILNTDPKKVCGVKVFMGSSTGNMLVDDKKALEGLFSECKMLIATHCEDEQTIQRNLEEQKKRFGEDIPVRMHPFIRNAEACYRSSSFAVELAAKYNTRLHILHISTAKETTLFNPGPPADKKITSEACIHHLWFSDADYAEKGNLIKWNPAVKTPTDREAIWKAVKDGRIDVVCTDHAPHTLEEKNAKYLSAPSGGPLVQHSLVAMLEFYHQGRISLEKIAGKMSHNLALCFQIENRGYIRKGYYADIVLADLNSPWSVRKENLLYKCGWSPFEGQQFTSKVTHTFVNGCLVYDNSSRNELGKLNPGSTGMRLTFSR